MAFVTNQIKKDTEKFNLYVPETDSEPKDAPTILEAGRDQVNTGFVKASDMVVTTPVEAEVKSVKTETPVVSDDPPAIVGESLLVKKRVSRLVATENGSYQPAPPVTPKSSSIDSDLIAKAKEIEARLSTQISMMSKPTSEVVDTKLNKSVDSKTSSGSKISKHSSKSSSFRSSKRSLERQTSLDRFFTNKRPKLDSPTENQSETMPTIPETGKRVSSDSVKTEVDHERKQSRSTHLKDESRTESSPPKTERTIVAKANSREEKLKPSPNKEIKREKMESSSTSSISSIKKPPVTPKASKSRSSNISPGKTKTSPNKSKQDIADLVIKCLMPLYEAKNIGSRELFKTLARHLSHVVRSATPPLTGISET